MESKLVFTHTERELLPLLDELRRREPIFHSAEFGTSVVDFERGTASDYWQGEHPADAIAARSFFGTFTLSSCEC
jgi:hypothetical protein